MIARTLLVLAACALVGCSEDKRDPSQWPMTREELAQRAGSGDPAERTYRQYCIGCHGMDGRGNGGLTGADLTLAGGPLADKSDEALIASVRDGKRGATATMPPHKPVLSDAQIAAVVGYVRHRFGKASEPTPAQGSAHSAAP